MYISKLHEENAVNGAINKITEDFEKIVAVTKSKELKRYAKTFYKIIKNEKYTIKNKKIRKTINKTFNKQPNY